MIDSSGRIWSCSPTDSTCFDRPSARAVSSAAVKSGPSPTSSSRDGTFAAILANISTTAVTRFTGRKFETWMTTFSQPGGQYRARSRGSGVRR